MSRYRLLVSYDGSAFHGWQIQPQVSTVEGELTRALARISRVDAKVQGASRTDAGVHAFGQVAHFDYEGRLSAEQLAKALNAVSSRDVRVHACEPVDTEFHARHRARGKQYRYDLWVDRAHHPLYRHHTLHVTSRLDLEAMRRASQDFVGEHDFSALRSSTCDAPSPVLPLTRVDIEGEPPLIHIWVEGAAFLKYMVRTLVGTLLVVGRGKRAPDSIPELLATKDRKQAGETAKAIGLHLVWVKYPDFPWQNGHAALTSGHRGVVGAGPQRFLTTEGTESTEGLDH